MKFARAGYVSWPKSMSEPMTRPIDFTLPDHAGGRYHLGDELSQRSVIVVFYRGDW